MKMRIQIAAMLLSGFAAVHAGVSLNGLSSVNGLNGANGLNSVNGLNAVNGTAKASGLPAEAKNVVVRLNGIILANDSE